MNEINVKSAEIDIENLPAEEKTEARKLVQALQQGDNNAAIELIESGCPVNFTVGDKLDTPLHIACDSDYGLARSDEVIAAIIQKGGAIDAVNATGNTPFHNAVIGYNKSAEMEATLHLFLARGVNPNFKNNRGDTPFSLLTENLAVDAMLGKFARVIVLPAMMLESNYEANKALWDGLKEQDVNQIVQDVLPALRKSFFFPPHSSASSHGEVGANKELEAEFFRPIRLAKSALHPPNTVPNDLRPLHGNRQWYKILPDDYTTEKGLTVTCLASSDELIQEGKALSHCFSWSPMDRKCCLDSREQAMHVLSVRDRDGTPRATISAYLMPTGTSTTDFDKTIELPDGKEKLVLRHIAGKNERLPKKYILDAIQEFREHASSQMKVEHLGEKEESKERFRGNAAELAAGFTPTKEHLQQCFDFFRLDRLRQCIGINRENSRMEFDDLLSPYDEVNAGFSAKYAPIDRKHRHHLVDGFIAIGTDGSAALDCSGEPMLRLHSHTLPDTEGAEVLRLHHVGVNSWMKATGLIDVIHSKILEVFPDIPERDALQEIWANERAEINYRSVPKRFSDDQTELPAQERAM